MEHELRNIKDFLSLYNKVTELCFGSCVDNFFTRNISEQEAACTDSCVRKYTSFNQRMLQVYVGVQQDINTKRYAELENQQNAQLAAAAEATKEQIAEIPSVTDSITLPIAPEIIPPSTESSSTGINVQS